MNISATGTSSVTALYIQQLLESSSASRSGGSSSGDDSSDLLTLSTAGLQASSGADPFRTDLAQLESTVSSGDLASAKKAYQAMAAKMKEHGDIPADFAAIGAALDAGDLASATSAVDKVQANAASQGPPPSSGANPLKDGLDQLSALLESGDLTGAKDLVASILKAQQGSLSSSYAKSMESVAASAYGNTVKAT